MPNHVIILKDSYYDSVLLMRISREVKSLAGIEDAAVVMATPQNKSLLSSAGYSDPEMDKAGPNDLIIVVRSTNIERDKIESAIADLLKADRHIEESEHQPRSLTAALRTASEINLAIISVPGLYAAREARRALERGLHVLLFSDNVSIEDEISLKLQALRRGLLMMGPDCGTAIINGKPLAFANVVRSGSIGIVGASGTGIQEMTCCIHRLGGGISQAIGTGGRDLSDRVGGMMTIQGIEMLSADPTTQVIVVISKPPSPQVAESVLKSLAKASKPAVVHFVGANESSLDRKKNAIVFADSLAGAAEAACRLVGFTAGTEAISSIDPGLVSRLSAQLRPDTKLRGLFCGGTTGQEALALLSREKLEIRSNLQKDKTLRITGTQCVSGHVILDLGDDAFTVGRPHPMIEPVLRNERLHLEMQDSEVGVLLFDCLLGYGSHEDPAGILAEGVRSSRAIARQRSTELVAVASITGTELDPQGYQNQKHKLEDADVIVMENNRQAVLLAAAVLKQCASHH